MCVNKKFTYLSYPPMYALADSVILGVVCFRFHDIAPILMCVKNMIHEVLKYMRVSWSPK